MEAPGPARGGEGGCPGWGGGLHGAEGPLHGAGERVKLPSLLSWIRLSPAAGSFGVKPPEEHQQSHASQLRSFVPCSSGLGLAEVFWYLYSGRQTPAPEGCRHLGFLLADLIFGFTPDALLVHHKTFIQDDRDVGMAGGATAWGTSWLPWVAGR